MWLQKRLNKRIIKKAIWSDYVYQIEAEERIKEWLDNERERSSGLKSFLQWWVEEMKKEIIKKYDE
jgi:hypothetical protein